MGKDGPCYHCGVTSTPLWRNGPPEKPVLCNACGSRWRTKGTLANYTPLHARAEADDYEDPRVARLKTIPLEKRPEKIRKRKHNYENTVFGSYASDYNQVIQQSMDEDTCIRSSSGSAVSNSESYAQYGADTSDLTGPAQSALWEAQVPSKKRTFMPRPKPSSVEKLTQDLCAILHEQRSCYPSDSFEEELLFESATPMVSVEIGHGSVLFKHPSSLVREEESEASSLSVENKYCAANEAYSHPSQMTKQEPSKRSVGAILCAPVVQLSLKMKQDFDEKSVCRDIFTHDRMQLFWNHNSPLCHIDLNDVINFEVLLGYLSSEEQQQLLKYLPSSDSSQLPGSLKAMFGSTFFKENLSSFQQLLSEGVFSNSCSEATAEDLKTLKSLALSSLTKSKWLKLYNELKGRKFVQDADYSVVGLGAKPRLLKDLESGKRTYVGLNLNIADSQTAIALPTETRRFTLESSQFSDDSTDHGLLLDVPSNGFFPQAELLPISRFTAAESSSINPSMLGL